MLQVRDAQEQTSTEIKANLTSLISLLSQVYRSDLQQYSHSYFWPDVCPLDLVKGDSGLKVSGK